MICFFFIIFALSNTIICRHDWCCNSCDLLLFYYFCTVKHNKNFRLVWMLDVVICFFFIIFALSNTMHTANGISSRTLWFASFLLFLHCQTQSKVFCIPDWHSCDLLLFYYFCTVKHNTTFGNRVNFYVVICFFFIIFALSNTIFDAA